jgi:S1-C subfamily serine protease
MLEKKMEMEGLETEQKRNHVFPVAVIAVLMVLSLICFAGLYSLNQQVVSLQSEVASLQSAAETASNNHNSSFTTTSNTEGGSLSDLYETVENSVVTIECTFVEYTMPFGRRVTSEVQGSGFVSEYEGQMVIITNNHVVEDANSITVTFADGNTYDAEVLGADASNDLAVLSADSPASEYYPLEIVSSSTVRVGDYVVAIGSPYGLAGTMTTGIVSSLDRTVTISDDTGGSYDITGLIQTSAPINSGNSGGPLMTYDGQVIGITTAIVSNSDGLGFAIPSDTILSVMQTLLA